MTNFPTRNYSNATKSTVYIDEAGDLGIGKGTRWFVLTAVIVDCEDEKNIRADMLKIKSKLNINEIHLRKIQEFNKRAYIVRTLKDAKFTYINVIIDTMQLELNSLIAYNYACRLLIERVSWFLRDTNRLADIVLSARGTSRDRELIDYLQTKLISYSKNEITNMFLSIKAKPASQWDMLQLADVCATSMFLSHEINAYEICVPCFSKALSAHLYKHNDVIMNYGIKYFNKNMVPDKNLLHSKWICNQ